VASQGVSKTWTASDALTNTSTRCLAAVLRGCRHVCHFDSSTSYVARADRLSTARVISRTAFCAPQGVIYFAAARGQDTANAMRGSYLEITMSFTCGRDLPLRVVETGFAFPLLGSRAVLQTRARRNSSEWLPNQHPSIGTCSYCGSKLPKNGRRLYPMPDRKHHDCNIAALLDLSAETHRVARASGVRDPCDGSVQPHVEPVTM
jgi:hypothetical protein